MRACRLPLHVHIARPHEVSGQPMKTETPRPILLKDYKPSAYLIDRVDLDVALDATRTRVRSRLRLRPNPAAKANGAALVLDGEHLELVGVELDGKPLGATDYTTTSTALTLTRPPKGPFTLEIETICNPEANKALSGLYRSKSIYCTQCEAEGFRRITYFLDRPDVLAVYTVRIEADRNEAPVLLSNGNLVERGTIRGGNRHYAIWKDPHPKPAYLFALVGGNLSSVASTFTTMSGREVDLRIYVEPGKEDRCGWAMDSLKRSMRWDEERFGREYDLDIFMIVAVSDFNMGAMENKGLNIFNDRLVLASPATATDAAFEAIESVIAHEYFHNWTGNRITCRDWFQLCLKEGLTVYRDQEFSADERDRTVQRIADVRQLKAHQFPEDAGPLSHPVRPDKYIEINNFYTATVYEKGAELCRMIETIVGRDGFRRGMDLYFERHDGEAATVEQFVACFAGANRADLGQFMTWYAQAGTPELVCSMKYDRNRKVAELTVNQVLSGPGESKKKPLHIPVRLGLVGGNGQDCELKLDNGETLEDGVVHVTRASQVFRFTEIASRPVPSLLRGFSAPVNLTIDLSDADLEFLMAHDSDLYNRWYAAQAYATRVVTGAVRAIRKGERPERATRFAKALGATISDESLEPAYRAQMLTLLSESDIAREIRRDVDPEAIHKARRGLARTVGQTLGDGLVDIYGRYDTRGEYSPDAKSAGRRALRNAALALLAARGRPEDLARTAAHYWKARNNTDETAGLALLSDLKTPERTRALDHFFERWKGDHIVIDKWFSFQAISSLPTTLRTVEALTRHPLFSLQNPNKVRALIGAFATANPLHFNRDDGKGYELVATHVLALDAFNPQIAARMASAFRSWRTLESGRRRLARKALQRMAKHKGLSRDVFEIVSRTLEEAA
jgi:aminopeptidase N